jgi:hypothetical protein
VQLLKEEITWTYWLLVAALHLRWTGTYRIYRWDNS